MKTALGYRLERALKGTVHDVVVQFQYIDWLEYAGAEVIECAVKSQSGNGQYKVFLALQGEMVAEATCNCPDFNNEELDWSEDKHPAGIPYLTNLIGRHRMCKHVLLALRKADEDAFRAVQVHERLIQRWARTPARPDGQRGLVSIPGEIKDPQKWARNIARGRS